MLLPAWTYVAVLGFMCLICVMIGFVTYGWLQFSEGWKERDSTKAWIGVLAFAVVFLSTIYFTRAHLNWPPDYVAPVQPAPQIIIVTATPKPTGTPEF